MKAIVYQGQRDVRYEDVPDPKILAPTDAIVRIERTAICGSDLHLYHAEAMGGPAFPLGHEFLGTVEDVGGDVRRFKRGDRVLVSCTIGCGHCSFCHEDLYSGCSETNGLGPVTNIFGTPMNPGGQAEGARVPHADTNLFAIPAGLDDEQVLFLTDILPTGTLGADLAEVGPGDVAVVFGCGPVGTFAQEAALLRGAACVVAVDLDPGRLARAEAQGCIPIDPKEIDLKTRIAELTHGRGADCAIEAVGRSALVGTALDIVRPGGRVSVIGVIAGEAVDIDFVPTLLGKNLTLRSGIVNPQAYFAKLLPMIERGRIDPARIITHRMPLAEGGRAYEIFDNHEEDVLKVVMTP